MPCGIGQHARYSIAILAWQPWQLIQQNDTMKARSMVAVKELLTVPS